MIPDFVMQIAPMAFLFVIFYFLLIRPQQRKMKQHQDMVSNLRRGDRVVTNGGLIGTVVKLIDDQEVQLEIDENVKVRVVRGMISDLMTKSQPTKVTSTSVSEETTPEKKVVKRKTAGK